MFVLTWPNLEKCWCYREQWTPQAQTGNPTDRTAIRQAASRKLVAFETGDHEPICEHYDFIYIYIQYIVLCVAMQVVVATEHR